ncbi:class I SAM-dependent methyltransferase [Neolewinella litorea]|uniref:Class I SAM-dependent methyltransferase n=1 Tax=Neolewinella litorea TaxID=2562452 RepID=A0A4S4NKB3_9BACT|nr:class I SAM-dependent methyltransferase [Neolewinella litorea]THH39385.1 class I SAM-dependent methyltransferase [Neolewinella litorea]
MFDLIRILRPLPDPPAAYRTPEGVYNLLPRSEKPANYVEHYQRDAQEFDYFAAPPDPATRHENQRLHEVILRHLPAAARVVLDVGCGSAWVARELLGRKDAVISFDLALRNTTEALRLYPAPSHFAVTGDVLALPFQDNSVDAIISSEVIEHVPEVTPYLENLIRVVRPGGTIILSTPYNETIQYSLCVHCNRPTPLHAHLHSFNEARVISLLDPQPDIRFRMEKFSNKALLYLRTHRLLRHFPHRLWRTVDRFANWIVDKPARLVIVIEKLEHQPSTPPTPSSSKP